MTTNETDPRLRPLTLQQRQVLMAGLNPARISKKPNTNLSYLEAWDVKACLIKAFGFGGYSSEVLSSEIIKAEQVPQASNPQKMNWVVTSKATVRLTIHQTGAVYTEAAIASSKQPDFTESADMSLKSAASDGLKRCAIFLGTQFGLSLYNDGSEVDVVGKCVAPGQEWPPTPGELEAWNKHASEQAEIAQRAQGENAGKASANPRVSVPAEGVTPEQHQDNLDLVNKAIRSKSKADAAKAEATA